MIFNQAALIEVVRRLSAHKGQDYLIKHYEAPLKAIPILHIMSFDDEDLYVGGYHTGAASSGECALYIRQPEIAAFVADYWKTLWDEAIPHNDGAGLRWAKLQHVAQEWVWTIWQLRRYGERPRRHGQNDSAGTNTSWLAAQSRIVCSFYALHTWVSFRARSFGSYS